MGSISSPIVTMDIISKDTEASYEHSPDTEGTTHQSAIGPKPTRKHFFSPLDSTYADAVHKDAETVQFTPEEDVCHCSILLWIIE